MNERALLSAQHHVQLEQQLGNALQEGLQQSEHAQISSQTGDKVVLLFYLFHWVFCSPPGHPEPSLQHLVVPVSKMKTKSDGLMDSSICQPSALPGGGGGGNR